MLKELNDISEYTFLYKYRPVNELVLLRVKTKFHMFFGHKMKVYLTFYFLVNTIIVSVNWIYLDVTY